MKSGKSGTGRIRADACICAAHLCICTKFHEHTVLENYGAATRGGQGEFVMLTAGKSWVDSPTRSPLLLGKGCGGQWRLRNTNKKPCYITSHSCHQPLMMRMMAEEKGRESGLPSFLGSQLSSAVSVECSLVSGVKRRLLSCVTCLHCSDEKKCICMYELP